ncbi:hypothetical protein C8R46DRAFT_1191971 [Mycena filopes]|nr:hypothetical protein C8R46DRAFT_1191971 [Mycena filopes]
MSRSDSKETICFVERRVPTELLSEILHATRPLASAPWHLGLVCQRWRACSLRDPSLWSSIELDRSWRSGSQIARHYPLEALQTQMLRSGELPLDVILKSGVHDPSSGVQYHLLALLEIVVRQSHRWGKLHLEWHLQDSVLEKIRGRLPRLHHLELGASFSLYGEIFDIVPQLRKFFLSGIHSDPASLSIPWSQITHFRGRFPAWGCRDIFFRTKLEECSFEICQGWHGSTPPPGTPVALVPRLRRLAVTGRGLLPVLEAPNLEYLFLDTPVSAVPFILRSQCCLKGLEISSSVSSEVTRLITHIPTLLHLRAYFVGPSGIRQPAEKLFRVLDVCPQLESIDLTFSDVPCPYDALYELIVARRRTLRFVCIRKRDGTFPPAVKERLQALGGHFLDIILHDVESMDMAWTHNATEDMKRP